MGTRIKRFGFICLPLAVLLAFSLPLYSQSQKSDWRKQFKHARYVIFSWGGAIDQYQLNLLQGSLTGKMVDKMISWREDARKVVADLGDCPPKYKKARELLGQIADLLTKQESILTGRQNVILHLEEWRKNKGEIKRLHKELNVALKL